MNKVESSPVGCLKAVVALVIVAVVGYSDVLYIGLVRQFFPPGLLTVACYLGAVTTAASILLLTAGKTWWFRPGTNQLRVAWGFTVLEVAIMILNDVMAGHPDMLHDQILMYYGEFLTAVPVVSLVGWILMLYFDPAQRKKHAEMKMREEIEVSEIDFSMAQHDAAMQARYKVLKMSTELLTEQIDSAQNYEQLSLGAGRMAANIVKELTGGIAVNKSIDSAPVSIKMSNARVADVANEPPIKKKVVQAEN